MRVNQDDKGSRGIRIVPLMIVAVREWWEDMTAKGGEGMVVKPLDFIVFGKRVIIQPAIKCRGPEYLRIIEGPEFSRGDNLERLRNPGLSTKRSMATRQFALGVECVSSAIQHGKTED